MRTAAKAIATALCSLLLVTPSALSDSLSKSNPNQSTSLSPLYPKIFAVRAELERVYQQPLREHLYLHFLPKSQFAAITGLGNGSNAMYNNGHLYFAMDSESPQPAHKLETTLRHELSHSFVGTLSKSRCPAWLDEGLAQYFEGVSVQRTNQTLESWLSSNKPLTLFALNQNLTLLDPAIVRTAYAHSLYATRSLINRKGFSAIREFLHALGKEMDEQAAFEQAFGIDLEQFDTALQQRLSSGRM